MNKQMTSCTITNVLSIHSARSAKVEAKITIETKTALSKKCWTLGLSESNYIARLLESSLFGEEHAVENFRKQLHCITGKSINTQE